MRCILVEATAKINGVETVIRLASRGFTTGPTEAPPNVEYDSIIQNGVSLNESVSVSGSASMSYGDIELDNSDGEYDHWLQGVWVNRPMTVLHGDVRWLRADFVPVFVGVVADIDSRARNRINVKFRDKLQLLNTAVNEVKLGGLTDNKERLLPVLLGECHNVEPLLIDPAEHEYQINIGNTEGIIEVRDDGVPVGVSATLSTGKFKLVAQPVGQITVSAQGVKSVTYVNSAVGLIKLLVKNYGLAQHRFTDADLDLTSLQAFDLKNPYPLGYYIADKSNVLAVCQELAASVGAMVIVSRLGKLRLIQVNPAYDPNLVVADITIEDMLNRSLKVVEKLDVFASVKLGYCKNWTVQAKLESGIPVEHKNLFKEEWLDYTAKNATVAADYRLHVTPEREETFLLAEADAITEAVRRLDLMGTPRCIYQYDGFANSTALELGTVVRITHDRFGLKNGKLGLVVGLQTNFLKSRTTVQVMI